MSKAIVLIPARYGSSRFPGKPLQQIAGKSLIQRVYENCSAGQFKAAVVTDDSRIEDHVRSFGGEVFRVDDDVPSGTERIALAYERFCENEFDTVVNVQGDEPLLSYSRIEGLLKFHEKSSYQLTTMVRPMKGMEGFDNPNFVKVAYNPANGQCWYFSRASIPHDRDGKNDFTWFHHIGVYCYNKEALQKFVQAPQGVYEQIEKLEQLRALELGFTIGATQIHEHLIGVDVPDDIARVEKVLAEGVLRDK